MSSSSNEMSVKVYYVENKTTKEIRKFSVDGDVLGNLEYLIGKIRQVFPDLLRKDFELFWKDEEEDYLTISSDDELDQAIQAIPIGASNMKIYTKAKGEKTTERSSKEHPGVTCDGCDGKVIGYRFKCNQCFDFDLCSTCEGKGVHPAEHEMVLIKTPRQRSDYYMRYPRIRPHCRGRAGPFFGHFQHGQFHGKRPFHCRFGGNWEKAETEQESQQNAESTSKENFKECVGKLASAFGLDPDVAVSSVKSFFDDVTKENEASEESKKPDEKEAASPEYMDDFLARFAQNFGIDPTFIAQVTTSLIPQSESKEEHSSEKEEEEKSQSSANVEEQNVDSKAEPSVNTMDNSSTSAAATEEKMETQANQASDKKTDKQGFEGMMSQFSQQYGFNPQNPPNLEGLGEMLQRMFQSFPIPQQNKNEMDQSSNQDNEEEPRKPDEFVFLDKNDEKLTEEEKHQQRLSKALRQMEAMGFDNDGGWLEQLLVSKELSIARVLDALNPQN